jgi:glutathione S-transferase
MENLELVVLSLRYSSWSMRAWLALTHAGVLFTTRTVTLSDQRPMTAQDGVVGADIPEERRETRRSIGSVTGLFPVLWADGIPIHESLAICEWAAESSPMAGLWPADPVRRAQARALSLEVVSGFSNVRTQMSCNVTARVPNFKPSVEAQREISRILELMTSSLEDSGGPFLFGNFGIVDCMYFPVLTRFETYGITLPESVSRYDAAVRGVPAVSAWREELATAPRIPPYDDYVLSLGGVLAPT